jgi:hypothetical protein
MPRLTAITFLTNSPSGLGSTQRIDADKPFGTAVGWVIGVRGPAVFLVSPPGWVQGQPETQRKPDGPRKVLEIPRSDCHLDWSFSHDEDVMAGLEKLARHDSEILATPEVRAKIEAEALERETAPKAKAR